MQSEKEAVEVFPKEYAEISTQMVEIKSTMQRHEQILKEEAARKNDLIAYLAHDLKTPLTSVIGYLSLLDEAVDMPTPQRAKYVSITLDKAKRLEKLINEFFEITRYNLQGIVLEKETIDLYYMLVQMTDEFYPLLQAHQNTTELDVDEEMTIYGDAENLARVFNNILKNAVAYSYRKAKNKEKYRAAHERDIILHEAAARAMKAAGVTKFPNLAALQSEYEALQAQKEALYADYYNKMRADDIEELSSQRNEDYSDRADDYKAAKQALLEGLRLSHLFSGNRKLTPEEKELWLLFDRVYVTELLARDEFAKGAYMLGAEDRETMLR